MDPDALAELLGVDLASLDTARHKTRKPQQVIAPRGTVVDEADLTRRLGIACELGHADLARLLLHAGASVNAHNTRGISPLFAACSHGHTAIASLLIEQHAYPSQANGEAAARAPLHAAAKRGDHEMARLLLAASADVHASARHRKATSSAPALWLTPLQLACSSSQSLVAGALLEHVGSDRAATTELLAASSAVGTALHCSAHAGDLQSARLLIANGAPLDAVSELPTCSLGLGLSPQRGPPLLSALLRCAPETKSTRRASAGRDAPPASSAVAAGLAIAASQVGRGASFNAVISGGSARHVAVATMLLDAGASPDATCTVGASEEVVGEAQIASAPASVLVLAAGGRSRANSARASERSLLEVCCMAGALEGVCVLLRHGATTSAVGSSLSSVCASAVAHGHPGLAELVSSTMDARAEDAMRALLHEEGGDQLVAPAAEHRPPSAAAAAPQQKPPVRGESGSRGLGGGGVDEGWAGGDETGEGRKARRGRARKGKVGVDQAIAPAAALPTTPSASTMPMAHGNVSELGLAQALLAGDARADVPLSSSRGARSSSSPLEVRSPVDASEETTSKHDATRSAMIRNALLGSGVRGTVANHALVDTTARDALAERSRRRRAMHAASAVADVSAAEEATPRTTAEGVPTVHEGTEEAAASEAAATALFTSDRHLFCCPLTRSLFTDPVCASDGHTYDRLAISAWLCSERGGTSPLTGEPMTNSTLLPNRLVGMQVERFKERHGIGH